MTSTFWAHYCPCDRGLLWVAKDEACNWCGLRCDPILAEESSSKRRQSGRPLAEPTDRRRDRETRRLRG